MANFKIPTINNEPNVRFIYHSIGSVANGRTQQHYAKGSVDRQKLQDAVTQMKSKAPIQVPVAVGGQHVRKAQQSKFVMI
jgi:1-pyrroline-5-carboxylate dehydrogenase